MSDAFEPARLEAEGWIRRNVACQPRLGEAVDLYRSLGMEVLLVPVSARSGAGGSEGACTVCFSADDDPDRYRVIYTRPARTGQEDDP